MFNRRWEWPACLNQSEPQPAMNTAPSPQFPSQPLCSGAGKDCQTGFGGKLLAALHCSRGYSHSNVPFIELVLVERPAETDRVTARFERIRAPARPPRLRRASMRAVQAVSELQKGKRSKRRSLCSHNPTHWRREREGHQSDAVASLIVTVPLLGCCTVMVPRPRP